MAAGRGEEIVTKYTTYYTVVGSKYPLTKAEARDSIDTLIQQVMDVCKVDEKRAVELLNSIE